jgi:hypothetical protein
MTQKSRGLVQAKKKLSRLDFRFHFASWWRDPTYVDDPASVLIFGTQHDYFNKTETEIGRAISPEQRAWYISTLENTFHGDWQLMKQEYPSHPDEAFEQSQEGVYYAKQLEMARLQNRILDIPHDPRLLVNTFWDLGKDDDTTIWFHQHVNGWDNWIDYFEASDQAFSYYTMHMQSLGYTGASITCRTMASTEAGGSIS